MMRVLGMISGTSHDGIDVAVVELQHAGDELHGTILHHGSTPYRPELRARLLAALPPAPTSLAEVCELDTLIGHAFADAAVAAADAAGPADLVVSHGQTVFHWVEANRALGTLQLGQPAWIAEAAGTPVLSDVRSRDIAARGHGAPLVPLLDVLLLGGTDGVVAALNLGGISNLTVIEDGEVRVAFDVGPANALLDAVVVERRANPLGYDEGGRLAASGQVDEGLLGALLDEPYYLLPPPKSTGKELFHLGYVRAALARSGSDPSTPDLLATLAELTVRTVAAAVRDSGAAVVMASGGGCHNPVLHERLAAAIAPARLARSDEFGAPSDAKEALAFAVIGWCTWHGLPGNEPAATGASGPRVLGSLTPGHGPLVLPAPLASPVRALRLTTR